MSDKEFYKILENFDKVESAADKLTPVTEEDMEVDEDQTRVQTMGNKVKVTTGSDTTEFDDAETAAAFMGDSDDDNQFATEGKMEDDEAAEAHKSWEKDDDTEKKEWKKPWEKDEDEDDDNQFATESKESDEDEWSSAMGHDGDDPEEMIGSADDDDQSRSRRKKKKEVNESEYVDPFFADQVNEAGIGNEWEEGGVTFDDFDDEPMTSGLGEAGGGFYKGDDDETRAADAAAMDAEFGVWDDTPLNPPSDEELALDDEFGVWDDEVTEEATCEDGPEFATFDSENEAHRKRLQRGTPVVLDKDLFTDQNVNRRGIFVNRSTSGFTGTVVRDLDGKEIKVHLSDIKSADLVNNSVYEEFELNFEDMLAEDITMTQTTNMENPENDTTTVTAIGQDAGEELAAMMANAGLNTGEYADMERGPEEVDDGRPAAEEPGEVQPVEMPMGDMIGMMDDPVEEAFGEMDPAEKIGYETDDMPYDWSNGEMEPSDTDLDSIDADPEWELDFETGEGMLSEDDIAYLSNEIAQAIVDGADIYELIHDESVPPKDREGLQRDIDELMLGGDNELTAYENLAQRIYDMYADADMNEERDIEYSNTPDELVAGADMVTHGTSGGLNRPKRMYKPAAGGDNAMQRPMKEDDLDEELSPKMQARKKADMERARANRDWSTRSKGSRLTGRARGTEQDDKSVRFGLGESDELVNEHESVDSFLNMYKEFKKK